MKPQLEICCYSVESVAAAASGGADRVELCASRPEGGVTPSYATIELAREVPGIGLYVIIRPRGGDFCYSAREFNCMKRDIAIAGRLGADGVVIGMLQPDGSVDKERLKVLVDAAGDMDITFHRAFDMSRDPEKALDDIRELGIYRVLSSGTRNTVDEGLPVLTALVRQAAGKQAATKQAAAKQAAAKQAGKAQQTAPERPGGKAQPDTEQSPGLEASDVPGAERQSGPDLRPMAIMAGSGVNAGNLEALYQAGIRQFHSSAAKSIPSVMQFRNPHIHMGKQGGRDEYVTWEADEQLVSQMRLKLDQLHRRG